MSHYSVGGGPGVASGAYDMLASGSSHAHSPVSPYVAGGSAYGSNTAGLMMVGPASGSAFASTAGGSVGSGGGTGHGGWYPGVPPSSMAGSMAGYAPAPMHAYTPGLVVGSGPLPKAPEFFGILQIRGIPFEYTHPCLRAKELQAQAIAMGQSPASLPRLPSCPFVSPAASWLRRVPEVGLSGLGHITVVDGGLDIPIRTALGWAAVRHRRCIILRQTRLAITPIQLVTEPLLLAYKAHEQTLVNSHAYLYQQSTGGSAAGFGMPQHPGAPYGGGPSGGSGMEQHYGGGSMYPGSSGAMGASGGGGAVPVAGGYGGMVIVPGPSAASATRTFPGVSVASGSSGGRIGPQAAAAAMGMRGAGGGTSGSGMMMMQHGVVAAMSGPDGGSGGEYYDPEAYSGAEGFVEEIDPHYHHIQLQSQHPGYQQHGQAQPSGSGAVGTGREMLSYVPAEYALMQQQQQQHQQYHQQQMMQQHQYTSPGAVSGAASMSPDGRVVVDAGGNDAGTGGAGTTYMILVSQPMSAMGHMSGMTSSVAPVDTVVPSGSAAVESVQGDGLPMFLGPQAHMQTHGVETTAGVHPSMALPSTVTSSGMMYSASGMPAVVDSVLQRLQDLSIEPHAAGATVTAGGAQAMTTSVPHLPLLPASSASSAVSPVHSEQIRSTYYYHQ